MSVDREQLPYTIFFSMIGVMFILTVAGFLAKTTLVEEGLKVALISWGLTVSVIAAILIVKLYDNCTPKVFFWGIILANGLVFTVGWLGTLFLDHILVPLIR